MFIIVEIRDIDVKYCKRHIPLYDVRYCCDTYDTAIEILNTIDRSYETVWNIRYIIKKVPLYGNEYNGIAYNLRVYNVKDITLIDTPYRYIDFGWYSSIDIIKGTYIYNEFINSQWNREVDLQIEDRKIIPTSITERVIFPFLSIVEFKVCRRILLS